jgi:predicted CoA-binding protein
MGSVADAEMTAMLRACSVIAVVGLKNSTSGDAYRIPLYMQRNGYRVVPVNPKLARGATIGAGGVPIAGKALGERVFASLPDIDTPVDMVNLFRASENIPAHVEEILAMSPQPRAVWMQLGIVNNGSAAKLRAAGIEVVQDRCLMVEHRRLLRAS